MLVRHVLGARLAARDAGVAHQNVDTPALVHHTRRGGFDLARIGHFHLDDVDVIALGLHRGLPLSGDFEIAVADIDMGAGFRQSLDAGKTDRLRAAGDERRLALEVVAREIHGANSSSIRMSPQLIQLPPSTLSVCATM